MLKRDLKKLEQRTGDNNSIANLLNDEDIVVGKSESDQEWWDY